MTRLGDLLNNIEKRKADKDLTLYGTATTFTKERAWYNPLRYILGKIKIKCVRITK